MWSVNLDASISEEYQTLGGHSCQPSEFLGAPATSLGAPGSTWEHWQQTWESRRQVWEHFESQLSSLGKTTFSLGMLLVRLEIITTTYRSTIFETHVFSLYSHLCIYVSI